MDIPGARRGACAERSPISLVRVVAECLTTTVEAHEQRKLVAATCSGEFLKICGRFLDFIYKDGTIGD